MTRPQNKNVNKQSGSSVLMDYDTSISTAHSPTRSPRAALLSNLEHNLASTPLTRSTATENPERRRKFSQVDPDSPLSSSITEARVRDLLCEVLAPIQKQLQDIHEAQERNDEATYFHQSLAELKTRNETLMTTLSNVENENKSLKAQLVMTESQARRVNLRFHGIPEMERENSEDRVHEYLSQAGFPYCPRAIERAHRHVPKSGGKPRPIIVRFNHAKYRDTIWKQLGHGTVPPAFDKPHVREDFPPEIEEARAQLLHIARAAMNYKDPHTNQTLHVKLVVDKLYVNNTKYTVDNLHTLPETLKPARLYTKMNDERVAFYSKHSPLSNHYRSSFIHKGETFNSAEQFIMTSKARLFGDQEAVVAIQKRTFTSKTKACWKDNKKLRSGSMENTSRRTDNTRSLIKVPAGR